VIELRKTILVGRPVEEVFVFLADPGNIARYVGPVRRIHAMTTPAVAPGTRLTVDARFLGMSINQRAECTRYEPPFRFETRSIGGRFYFEAGFTLHPTAEGTRIEGWGNASSPTLFRLAEPVLGFLIERQVDGDFARLKRELEAAV
jgi:carbon monoxide dehydrogenase subunit G